MSILTSPSLPSQRRPAAAASAPPAPPTPGPRRVRHEVRDGVAVFLFSAAASTALAGTMLLLLTLSGQGA